MITEGELEGPSLSQHVHDPDESFAIQRAGVLAEDCLVEAGATIAAHEAELKQKDEEIVAMKERLQASEQKLQWEEAKNAWLNEVTDTLRSEIQSLCNESTKAKLTRKVPDRDWYMRPSNGGRQILWLRTCGVFLKH
ncbi:hypothetical protein R1flu_000952 [Riccia fluitans]|uniref:Uncharacterized protein n=1 Tax=Riccia fluitans TaxID=41844 RepID=A0ABD1Y532_9MARC